MAEETGIINRVSIVTPVYNGEAYLHRLLESILAQNWPQIEMILSDDGSQDKTLAVARSFQERFRARGFSYHIVSGLHQNASAAINRALPLVTGEFLIWPDSDDALHPDSIRRRVEFLQTHPQYQCVRSLGCYRNEDGSPGPQQENMAYTETDDLFFPVLTGESFVCCGCYMLRCAAFFSIYPQRQIPTYDVGQNFQMLLPFLYKHRCPTIQEALYTVYVRPDSHSRRTLTPQEDEEKYAAFESLVDEIAAICQISDPSERFQIECWKRRRRYALYLQYQQRQKAAAQLLWLWRNGMMGTAAAGKEMVKIVCGPHALRRWWAFRTWIQHLLESSR